MKRAFHGMILFLLAAGLLAGCSAPASGQPSGQSADPAPVKESAQEKIGEDKAKEKALAEAGFSAAEVTELKVEADRENGKEVYEVGFKNGGFEYDIDVDAYTCEILLVEKEADD